MGCWSFCLEWCYIYRTSGVLYPSNTYCYIRLVSCWSFVSWQHGRSYQDWYQLVTVHIHGDFIVLPHWETKPPVPWYSFILSWLWANQSLPYPNNTNRQAKKRHIAIFKSLFWLDQWSSPQSADYMTSQSGKCMLYSFSHSVWFPNILLSHMIVRLSFWVCLSFFICFKH